MKEESRRMMPPDVLTFFGDYITGIAVTVVLAVAGALLVMTNRKRPQTIA
jgi:hypothetical protein